MKRVVTWMSLIALGLLLGLGSALLALNSVISTGWVSNGHWSTSENIGSADAGMYLRAAIAIKGLLGLRRQEVIYFSTAKDSEGRPLVAACDYQLIGSPPKARWWSVTVYGNDNYLIDNPQDRYSASRASLDFEEDGSFILNLSRRPQQGNWIPTASAAADSKFDLTLRLYNPDESVYQNLSGTPLPRVVRVGCADA